MADLARAIGALMLLWLLGAALLEALGVRRRRPHLVWAQPSIDLALGASIVATVYTLSALVGGPARPALVYAAAVALGLAALARRRWRPPTAEELPAAPPEGWFRWLAIPVAVVMLLAVAGVIRHTSRQAMFWDGRYIWAFKAKAIVVDGGLDREAFTDFARYRHTHVDYPIAAPATTAWVYQAIGRVDERYSKAFGLASWLSIGLLLICFLRRWMSVTWAMGLAVVVLQIPMLAYHAGGAAADVPQAFCLLAAGALTAEWLDARRREDLLAAALLFGACALIKAEGSAMALGGAIALAALHFTGRGRLARREAVLAGAAIVGPFLPWALLRALWGIPSLQLVNLLHYPVLELYLRLGAVMNALGTAFASWRDWELVWSFIALGLATQLLVRPRKLPAAAMWWVVLWQVVVYVAVYVSSPYYEIGVHLRYSLDRVIMHVMPLGVAAAGVSLSVRGDKAQEASA